MDAKIRVQFIGKKSRTTKQDLLPIYLRATIQGKRFEVATHQHVKPSEWAPSAGKVKGKSESALETNMSLDLVRKQVYDYREEILSGNRDFTVGTLREKWFGECRKNRTLLGVFRSSILDLEKLQAKGLYKKSTVTKYRSTEKHLINFIAWRNGAKDILLQDLQISFAKHFEFYLQSEKGLSINVSGKMIKNLKKIVSDCVDKDWIDKNPFLRYRVRHIDPKIPHLNSDEIRLIENKTITIERLSIVRDIFLFSCYTGFAYIDVANLTQVHLKKGPDGKPWLIKSRQKTGIPERVPLIPPACVIIKKYKCHPALKGKDKLLPIPSNQKVNAYLKEIADICGLSINLTFHIARHTFATTVALDNGVPLDSVSKMLGHRSIKTTQIYAKVTDKKISDDTKVLFEAYSENN